MHEDCLLGGQRRAAGRVVQPDARGHLAAGLRVDHLDAHAAGGRRRFRHAGTRDGDVAERDAAARGHGKIGLQDPEAGEPRPLQPDRRLAEDHPALGLNLVRAAEPVAAVAIPRDGERLREIRRVGERHIDRFVDVERVVVGDVEGEQITEQARPAGDGLRLGRNLAAVQAELRSVGADDADDPIARPGEQLDAPGFGAVRVQGKGCASDPQATGNRHRACVHPTAADSHGGTSLDRPCGVAM